jgi:peptide chain release factor
MPDFGVHPNKTKQLFQAMKRMDIKESDLIETFIRSGGKGGQNVNKVATCVRLIHLPTKLEVKCQKSRQQLLNRYYARCLMVKKIEALKMGVDSPEAKRIEKIRKQKKKSKKRTKKKLLQDL